MQSRRVANGIAMKTCLIVDDSRVVRAVARRILENLDYAVQEVEDSAAGLQACRENMPDLIFLDWNLPQMKGVDFVKSVRGQKRALIRSYCFAPPNAIPPKWPAPWLPAPTII
jgi:CheY-like chemotaxis protein